MLCFYNLTTPKLFVAKHGHQSCVWKPRIRMDCAQRFYSISCLIFFLCLFTGIPVYIPCTGSVPANSVVSVVVGVCYLWEFLIISLPWTWIFIIVDKDAFLDDAKKYHKHLCISHTILVWFWALNWGFILSTIPFLLAVTECMVRDCKSGSSVFLLIHSSLLYLRSYIPITDMESPFPYKVKQNIKELYFVIDC